MFHGISVYSNVCLCIYMCFVVFIWLFFCLFCPILVCLTPMILNSRCISHFYACSNSLSLLGSLVSILGLPALSWLLKPTIKLPWCARKSPYALLRAPSCGGRVLLHWSWAFPMSLLVHLGTLWIKIIVTKFSLYLFWSAHSLPLSAPSWNLLSVIMASHLSPATTLELSPLSLSLLLGCWVLLSLTFFHSGVYSKSHGYIRYFLYALLGLYDIGILPLT